MWCEVTVHDCASELRKLQLNHTPQQLTNGDVRYLARLSNVKYFHEVIDNILVPRVVGTDGHEKVFKYIASELKKLDWTVEVDEFADDTPNFGRLVFKNIVGTLNPKADRYLVLACHYDSKYFQNEVFLGATDSAVPCAMMLNIAKVLKKEFESIKNNTDISLMLLFFDGEEAFENWGPKDSIYGARHLAKKFADSRNVASTGETVSQMQKIDLLILLDLLGHSNMNFYNYFENTGRWHEKMANIENRLDKLRLLNPRLTKYFIQRNYFNGRIEDDHIPFLKKNVPILHMIPLPFPPEWHTPKDNRNIIDINAVENINKILRIFIVQYLHIYLPDNEEPLPEKEL
ncbi:hypothetical protein GWI33_020057 [Rhynchophorus ferrugineus]|uniref:Glutaminyl-peptide cyclotransferase n=1 Tax=Rhynchophorus ferrugineus TaxID=354439 RepID=A0A834M0R7_RHYFE|nr:hypothetical protein GWI33_020057 [Rhynchophorus ferrugineus]